MVILSLLVVFLLCKLIVAFFCVIGRLVKACLMKAKGAVVTRRKTGFRRSRLVPAAANESWTGVKLFDVVSLDVDLPLDGLSKGMTGTIVYEFNGRTPAYEVEFCDSEGRTIHTLSLLPSQFSLVWSAPEAEDAGMSENGSTEFPALMADSRREEVFTYESFMECNRPGTPCQLSYIDAVKQLGGVSDEFFTYFTRIFNPVFVVVDRNIFVEVCFDRQRLEDETARGLPYDDLPFWHNLLEVTQLCEDMEWDEVCELAYVISDCWNAKLKRLHPDSGFVSEVFIDNELDEVFVGLHRKRSCG
jgi:hypothetical protein